jgi:hypothetical protein
MARNEVEHRIEMSRIAEALEAIRREYLISEAFGDRPQTLPQANLRILRSGSGFQHACHSKSVHMARRAALRIGAAALAALIDLGPEEELRPGEGRGV